MHKRKEKFTPGPWELNINDTGDEFSGYPLSISNEALDKTIINYHTQFKNFGLRIGDSSEEELIANASLISSAPDLYESLQWAVKWIRSRNPEMCESEPFKKMELALSKASPTITTKKKFSETTFNFDLERMKKAVNSKSVTMPHFETFEDFDAWLNNLTDEDFK